MYCSSAADLLWMSVMRWMRGVSGVCVWLGRRGWRGGEWMRGLGLVITNPVGTGRVLDVCFGCGGVGGEWVGGLDQCLEGWVVLRLCEL